MDSEDDDMFDVFDQPAPKALEDDEAPPADAAATPADADAGAGSKKRKAEDAAPPAAKRTTPAAAAAAATDPLQRAMSREYQMLDLYIKDKMENAKRIKGLASLNVTPKREVPSAEGRSSCTHEVAFPPGEDTIAGHKAAQDEMAKPVKRAKEYPFTLDSFQQISTKAIDIGQSVLVSAHTSAGKTAVAEYAIAKSLRDGQRVVYTCPIKALSNQKYRDLYEEFQDVGLMTGDVTINPSASCIVMTTEILRSMLYRGASETREIAWVIYDEVHYMRDKERGVVWEESIVMLPSQVRFVFLSATIPNATEFAAWVAKVHRQPCNVVYTDYRPTPLQHYMFPADGDGLHLVVDEKGEFRADNFQKVVAQISEADGGGRGGGRGGRGGGRGGGGRISGGGARGGRGRSTGGSDAQSDIFRIVKMIMEKNMDPTIVFAFSKKECESLAMQVGKLDFNDDAEKDLVEQVYTNAIDSLGEDDKLLPQIEHMLPLLKRGVGMHHSGLLPILKEVVEILFQEHLIKCLFATETFSMGLNMPARTVVFTALRKFDGQAFRWVSPGEYIQMSGRAGRRGLDDKGIVIQMVDEKLEPAIAKDMLKGSTDPLNSTFHLGYNMLLNLYRVEDANPEKMIISSFLQFQNDVGQPDHQADLDRLEESLTEIEVPNEEAVAEYFHLKRAIETLQEKLQVYKTKPLYCLPFLQPGRLVRVQDGADAWGWGLVVSFQKLKKFKGLATNESKAEHYTVDVLLRCATGSVSVGLDGAAPKPRPCTDDSDKGEMHVVPVHLHLVAALSSIRLFMPKDLRSSDARSSVGKTMQVVLERKEFVDAVPELDMVEDMKVKDESVKKSIKKIATLDDKLKQSSLHGSEELAPAYAAFAKKMAIKDKARDVKRQMKQSSEMILKDELKGMKRVLRRLGMMNSDNVVEVKGRVACEVDSADELVITELIFNNSFSDLSVEQLVALCSCFVYGEKASEEAENGLEEVLTTPLRMLQVRPPFRWHSCAHARTLACPPLSRDRSSEID
jgi:ATP-dependent RNA helicase DOB1